MEIPSGVYTVVGVIIGAVITQISNFFQQQKQLKKEQIRIAYEMGVKEYETIIKNGKPSAKVVPLEIFVLYYLKSAKNFQI